MLILLLRLLWCATRINYSTIDVLCGVFTEIVTGVQFSLDCERLITVSGDGLV